MVLILEKVVGEEDKTWNRIIPGVILTWLIYPSD